MKITILTGPFHAPPPARGGAVERRWFYVAQEFVKLGHDVTFFQKRQDGTLKRETLEGVNHVRRWNLKATRYFPINLLLDFTYAARMIASLPKADILVTNDFFAPAIASRLKKSAGKISINVARVPKGQLFMYKAVDRLVGVSTAIKNAIVRERPDFASKARFVPNPIDTTVFVPSDHEPDQPTITYTGRVHPEKGLDKLCEAFAMLREKHPDLRLKIIGGWKIEDGGGGRALVDELKSIAGEGAEFFDPIYDRQKLAEAIRDSSVYCYPSQAEMGEAFPCAPLEAMGCGRAVVVSQLEQFHDYIRDDENGVYFDHRGEAAATNLAEAIGNLLSDPSRRERLQAAAAETAKAYSFRAIAEMYLADFEEMLGRGPGLPADHRAEPFASAATDDATPT